MKNKILLTFLTITVYACNLLAQPGAWTWLKGDPNLNSAFLGNNGIQGVPAATNQPPFFYEAPTLMDSLGNLFLIGGGNGNGQWSDVWRYNTATNEWTWMKGTGMGNATGVYGVKGVSSPTNQPADISLGSSYDNTKSGIFYIYGGSANISNNLWLFNPYINEWTWLNGNGNGGFTTPVYGVMGVPSPANSPGGRTEGLPSWCDSVGNFWIYGGSGGGTYGDLWKWDVSISQWAWMGGSSNSLPANYGTKNVAAATNYPGARSFCSAWKLHNNELWLGNGANSSGNSINDIWKYDINTNLWVWEGGSSLGSPNQNLGTKCNPAPSVMPNPSSEIKACWTFCDNLYAIHSSYNYTTAFNTVTKNFTWISGSQIPNAPGIYGTLGVPSVNNVCATKFGGAAWYKHPYAYVYSGIYGGTDMMRFEPDTTCGDYLNGCSQPVSVLAVNFASSDTILCEKNAVDFFDLSAGNPTQWQWYFPGASPDTSTAQNPTGIYYASYGTYPVTLVVSNGNGSDSVTINIFIQVVPQPAKPIVTVNGNILCSSAASYYQWYYNGTLIPFATAQCYTTSQLGNYFVIVTDSNGCQNTSDLVLLNKVADNANSNQIQLIPQPAKENVSVQITNNIYGKLQLQVTDIVGRVIYEKEQIKNYHYFETAIDCKAWPNGTYTVGVNLDGTFFSKRMVKY